VAYKSHDYRSNRDYLANAAFRTSLTDADPAAEECTGVNR
jgi:hypothetical protein